MNPQRWKGTRTECNFYAIGPNDGDKNQTGKNKTNEMLGQRRVGKGLANGVRRRVVGLVPVWPRRVAS